jgi:hypothetical protein
MVEYIHQPPGDLRGGAGPDWPAIRELAAGQAAHFTAAQAIARGFSEQLLSKHVAGGTLLRPLRGIYRLAHFPPAPNEDLVVGWLWSAERAVVSHESALQLHELSDALPARIHLTLPAAGASRRRVVPPLYIVHFADVPKADRAWIGPVPVTKPARTVCDVAAGHGDPTLVGQAVEQGIARGLFHAGQVSAAVAYAGNFETPGWRVFPEAIGDLGDAWVIRAFSGTCRKPLPSDWPTLAEPMVRRHGGRVYYESYQGRSGILSLHVAWPMPGPDAAAGRALRRDLAKAFAWR